MACAEFVKQRWLDDLATVRALPLAPRCPFKTRHGPHFYPWCMGRITVTIPVHSGSPALGPEDPAACASDHSLFTILAEQHLTVHCELRDISGAPGP